MTKINQSFTYKMAAKINWHIWHDYYVTATLCTYDLFKSDAHDRLRVLSLVLCGPEECKAALSSSSRISSSRPIVNLVFAECHAEQHHGRVADCRKRRRRVAAVVLEQEVETCARRTHKQSAS